MSEMKTDITSDWLSIEQQLDNLQAVDGGFSQAKRGLIVLPDGHEVFVKIGLQDNTKKWAKKEVGVYRFLGKHNYPHAPRLVATNADETAFALEAFTPKHGWNWQDAWDSERLSVTIQAMDELAQITLDDEERVYFADRMISEADDGWQPLVRSSDKQQILREKLHGIGVDDIATGLDFSEAAKRSSEYVFRRDTLVHHDVRADNAAWNAKMKQVRIVDWNWTQLGDKDIEMAATLTHIQKSGYDVPQELLQRLNAEALHWMAGFWFNSAATPIWKGGPEHLRDFQLLAGVTALRLVEHLNG